MLQQLTLQCFFQGESCLVLALALAIPLYLSEMAPTHLRGGLNMMFQLATTLGIFSANMINYGTSNLDQWGWRLSLGLAAAPALLMTVSGIFLPETPNSLIEQGSREKGRKVLERIRGTQHVDAEFEDMIDASEMANSIKHLSGTFWKRGIDRSYTGFKGNASLYASALTGAVLTLSTLVTVGIILGLKFGDEQELSKGYSIAVVIVICLFVAAFGRSWGPLGWTVPSEIFPLETRSAGQSIRVALNLFFTFIIAQSFLSLLCGLKFGLFLFFAGWIIVMTVFVEEMVLMWHRHWFWKKIISENP
ncbi:hypothetical protein L1987_64811 [Smallanthus sonchifolius]|uniref:Uncharacterized protein n=1 Tax=Smallanthus sonchifolius TaxID=185202 RepID=A0ACB9BSN4_9ASTR|nr:hypothetical protein L1987_64811 [Smallanthus sonchifolius]